VADIPLFHSIAQTSATFVAIIAGFYATKIISLSNDKRRILQRINALDNEIQAKKVYLEGLENTESDTVNRWDKKYVSGFINYIYNNFNAYEQIHSFEDLREWYKKYYDQSITENEERILKENSPQDKGFYQRFSMVLIISLTLSSMCERNSITSSITDLLKTVRIP
jgi:hypothetical protein